MEVCDLKESQLHWAPLADRDTAYVGQLVKSNPVAGGVVNAGAASGAGDTTGKAVLCGVVVGVDDRTPTHNATYRGNQVTSVVSQADLVARSSVPSSSLGVWPKGDHKAKVRIALIDATTKVRVPIYNAAYGTAITTLTVTTGSTTGLGFTSNSCDFTPVGDLETAYCRTGANRGIMNITDDSDDAVAENDIAFDYDIAVGDTFVRVPMRYFGPSYVQTDAEATFFDASASPATDYWIFNVLSLHLAESGREYVEGMFHPCHFDLVRA